MQLVSVVSPLKSNPFPLLSRNVQLLRLAFPRPYMPSPLPMNLQSARVTLLSRAANPAPTLSIKVQLARVRSLESRLYKPSYAFPVKVQLAIVRAPPSQNIPKPATSPSRA